MPGRRKPTAAQAVAIEREKRRLSAAQSDAEDMLARCRARTDAKVRRAVAAVRAAGGSWQDVGEALGVSRQTAHDRFADLNGDQAGDQP